MLVTGQLEGHALRLPNKDRTTYVTSPSPLNKTTHRYVTSGRRPQEIRTLIGTINALRTVTRDNSGTGSRTAPRTGTRNQGRGEVPVL